MKVKKKYSFTNERTIWRLLPSDDKLLIEERDGENKQVYFNCINIDSGKNILSSFQLDEKFWVGVEAFENNRIYFHKFIKSDMPGHAGIIVFSLNNKAILWSREDIVFLFLNDENVFAFRQKFESRDYFLIDAQSGNILKEYGEDVKEINKLRERSIGDQYENYENYYFPETYIPGKISPDAEKLIKAKKDDIVVSGSIEYIIKNNILFLGYHTIAGESRLENNFNLIDMIAVAAQRE